MTDSSRSAWAALHLEASFMGPTDDVSTPGACLELSRSQLFLGTGEPAPQGQVVRFEIGTDSHLGTIRGAGKVLWTSEGEGTEAPRGMALRLLRLDPGCVQILEMYLATAPLGDTGTRPLLRRSDPPPDRVNEEPSAPPPSALPRARRSVLPNPASRTGVGVYSLLPEAEEPSARRPSDPDHAATRRLRERLAAAGVLEPDAAVEPRLQARANTSTEPPEPPEPLELPELPELSELSEPPELLELPELPESVLPAIPRAAALPVELRNVAPSPPPPPMALAVAQGHDAGGARSDRLLPGADNPTPSVPAPVLDEQGLTPTPAHGLLPLSVSPISPPVLELPRQIPLTAAVSAAPLQLRSWRPRVALVIVLCVGGYFGHRSYVMQPASSSVAPASMPAAPPSPSSSPSPPPPPPPLSPPPRAPVAVAPARPEPEGVVPAAGRSPAPAVTASSKTAVSPATKRSRTAPVSDPSGSASRLEAAIACVSRGDNACVIGTLEGKAHSPREFELLIETYRSSGQAAAARTAAERLLALHPEAREAKRYARLYKLPIPE